jgi:hypothetical protein
MSQAVLFEKPAAKPRRMLYTLRRDKEGWWVYGEPITPDVPWWGPWGTKGDAAEAARSHARNNTSVMRPCDIKSEWRGKRRAKA